MKCCPFEWRCNALISLVREGGVEPPRAFTHWILSPARLPIPPLSQQELTVHYALDFCPLCPGLRPARPGLSTPMSNLFADVRESLPEERIGAEREGEFAERGRAGAFALAVGQLMTFE